MIVLAAVPTVWRRVMDPRVVRHFDGDLTRANLQPRKRDKILAKYPPPSTHAGGGPTGTPGDGSVTPAPAEVMAARCPGCGYTYEVEAGDEHEGFAAGTAWAEIPDDWCCPDCGVREKVDFVAVERVDAA
jgi:alkane 1-monooxygenase